MTNSGKKWYNNGTINKMFSGDDIIPTNVEYIIVIDTANIEAQERGKFQKGNKQGVRFTPSNND